MFNIGEWNRFGLDAEFAAAGQGPHLGESLEDRFVRNTPPAAPVQLEPRTPQGCRGKCDRRTSHLSDLHDAGSGSGALHIMTSEGLQQDFRFYVWDEHTGEVRWMCSWDTREEDVDAFASAVADALSPVR